MSRKTATALVVVDTIRLPPHDDNAQIERQKRKAESHTANTESLPLVNLTFRTE